MARPSSSSALRAAFLLAALAVALGGCDAPSTLNGNDSKTTFTAEAQRSQRTTALQDVQAAAPSSAPPLRPLRLCGESPVVAASKADDTRPVVGLVPSGDTRVTAALVEGATRAFAESRAAGGPELTLVVGSAGSQWATVASETVRLACEEHVLAVIGPPERALAHPVAQAATRCRVPMLSTSHAASVTAAGSRWVLSVVGLSDAPDRNVADSPTAEWTTAGYDAGRVAVEAARKGGLSRDAFVGAVTGATAVTSAGSQLRFDRLGRRESAAK